MSMAWVEIDGDRGQYAQSWAVSLLAHGMILTAAVTFVADLKFVPPQERFRWDVSVVEAPQPEQKETAQPPTRESKPTPPQPIPREEVSQPQPVVQAVPQVVQREVREVKAVQQVTRAISEAAVVTRTTQPSATPQEVTAPAEATPAMPTAAQSTNAPSAVETPTVTQARSIVESSSPAQPTQGSERPIERASIKELPVRSAPPTRPDYGWLMEALWRQVDRLKRYPHTARVNRWEGKVVLRAVIRDDGQVIDLSVEESSGYTVLDRDALEILKQASPLKLKHPLGQAQVVVHVPISYKLQ